MVPPADSLKRDDECQARATGYSRSDIEAVAGQISKRCGYTPAGNLEKLVTFLGGSIFVKSTSESDNSGHIVVRGPGDFDIYLSPFTGPFRDRFTIAHELGHYFLHSRGGEVALTIAREGSNRAECEANWFAAAFLMPEELFRVQWEAHEGDVPTVAALFAVSRQAADIRSRRLGLR